ncbi:MAG: hypothetical protein JW795_00435, partial [Chitinivibrionales bacterium]|nr:hypothetical protein [Chitinivibrionales bacterium]
MQKMIKRPVATIGFLTSVLTSRLSREIWAGIVDAASEEGFNCHCFVGELLYPPERTDQKERYANSVYDLISDKTIQGLIVYSGDVGQYLSTSQLIQFMDKFTQFPLVSIATPLPKIPSIMVDNYSGMHDLVTHCIRDHHYRSCAFVTGPSEHDEARVRLSAFQDALTENGIALNDNFI